MPALEASENMEAVVVDGGERAQLTPSCKTEDNNNNNNNTLPSARDTPGSNGEINGNTTKYSESSNSSNGYISPTSEFSSPKSRNSYDDIMPPIYMSTMSSGGPTTHTSYKSYSSSDSDSKYTNGSTNSTDFHRPYQTSPPNIQKAPSFVVRQLSEGNKSTTPPSPSTTPPDDKHVWSKSEIEMLLDLYETYKDQLKDPRVRKTKVWDDVARIIREKLDSDVTGCQCNQKFRNLKADFQKVLDHNGRPGNFKRVCKYYDRLASILSYQGQPPRGYPPMPHPSYPPMEIHENSMARVTKHRELYYENGHNSSSPKPPLKRKMSQDNLMLNGLQNGHHDMYYMDNKKPKTHCSCDCAQEVMTLRDTVERINNYIVAHSAHEEERMRRVEEMHREKLIALSRFVDVFKDFVIKMTEK